MELNRFVVGVLAGCLSAIVLPASAASLQETVRQAIQTNPDVLIETNERTARRQEVDQARAGYFPTVDIGAGIGHEISDNPSTRAAGDGDVHLDRREASVQMRQMIFDGFGTRSEIARQRARVDSSAYRVDGTAQNTGLRAVEVYLELLRRQELLALAQDNLKSHEEIHDRISRRSESGVGRRADEDQAKGRLALAQSNVIAEETNVRDAETNFLRVVGATPDGALEKPMVDDITLPGTMDEAVHIAVENHPTLKSAVADVEATKWQHEAAGHNFYPRWDFEVSATENNNLDGQRGDNDDFQAMVRMRYNILNGGKDRARRRETAQLIQEAAEVRNKTYRQVVESVRLSWSAYEAVGQQIGYLRDHMEASAISRDAYLKQFNIGQRTLLDLLDSENELFESRRAYTNATYDRMFSKYRILNGMGSLLDTLGVPLPKEAALIEDMPRPTPIH